jgi:hypothetical protein
MSTIKQSKINTLLSSLPSGIVIKSSWLTNQGYDLNLQKRYRNSNWFTSIGNGAMIRTGDQVTIEGGIYSLQHQSNLSVHIAGRTALTYLGKSHYLEFSPKKVTLFGVGKENLPKWFTRHEWGVLIDYHPTGLLPFNLGLENYTFKNFSIKISSPTRAIMEFIYLAHDEQDLMGCLEVMEGLNNLRPSQVQVLLDQCQSIKVKRLFMFIADKVGHAWFKHLKIETIDLGKGKRSFVKNGVYNEKYQITIPKELSNYGK